MDESVIDDVRRPVARRGLGRGLGAILPARGMPFPTAPGWVDPPLDVPQGLVRRPELLEELEAALTEARRERTAVTVVVFGLDGFRHVNAEFGHEVGDALIHALGERLARFRRAADVAARLAGDEFALLCPLTDATSAGRLVDRLSDTVGRPVVVSGFEHRLRATSGVAVARPARAAATAHVLLRQADLAMHRAKDSGADWLLHEPEGWTHGSGATAPRRRLVAFRYRPLVDLRTGTAVGVRAEARPPVGGVAPTTGVAVPGLEGVVDDLVAWQRASGRSPLRAWLEAEGAALARPEALRAVEEILAGSGVRPSSVGFVLRGVPAVVHPTVTESMRRLTAAGAGLCLEASAVLASAASGTELAQLADLAPSAVVLPAPVADALSCARRPGDARRAAYLAAAARSFAGMATELELEVHVEGIATEAAAAAAAAVGCTHASGDLFGPATTGDRLPSMGHTSPLP